MEYKGHVFEILWWDNDHGALRSQFRPDLSHVVDMLEQKCACENFTIDKNPDCKHLLFMRVIYEAVKNLKKPVDNLSTTPHNATFLTPTQPNSGDTD